MDEKTKQQILEDAEKLQRGVDRQLEETEESDLEFLQNFHEEFGYLSEQNQRLAQVQYRQRLRQVKRDPGLVAMCKEEGITPEQFVALEYRDPEAFAQELQIGTKRYIKRLKGELKEKQPDPFFDPSTSLKPHPRNVEKAREVAKSGKGDDKMVDDLIAALMYGE
jgi:hypothetical protein